MEYVYFSDVEVPVFNYSQPETGATVRHIGMVHIASPEFYREVWDEARYFEFAGGVVYCEGISGNDTEPALRLSPVATGMLLMADTLLRAVYKGTGLEGQYDRLTPPDSWVRGDVTISEAGNEVGILYGFRRIRDVINDVATVRRIPRAKRLSVIAEQIRRIINCRLDDEVEPEKSISDDYMVTKRSNLVMDALEGDLAQNPAQRSLLLWGVGHARDFRRRLDGMGFIETDPDSKVLIRGQYDSATEENKNIYSN